MATYTDYFSLIKPDAAENVNLSQLNQNTTKIDLIMHQNRQMSADAYDPQRAEPYDEGELAIFENVLYKCKEDNVSGTWNPTKWKVTTLAKEIANSGGGGGGGSSYVKTTLWSGSETPSTSGTDITLNANISDFDLLIFYVADSSYGGNNIYLVSDLTIGNTYIATIYANNYIGAYWDYTSDTSIKIKSQSSSYPQTYSKITGLKFGN